MPNAVPSRAAQEPLVVFVCSAVPHQFAPHPLMPAIWLTRRGHDVLCVCFGPGGETAFETPLGRVRARFIRSGGLLGALGRQVRLFFKLLAIRWRLPGKKVYYLHGHVVCPAARLALLCIKRRSLIYHTQDYLEPGRHPVWAFFERKLARRAGTVVSNEPNRARFMASNYRLRQVPLVVPTALPRDWPVPDFEPGIREAILERLRRKDDGRTCLVLHQGPLSPARCAGPLIGALAKLPDRFVLVLTGIERNSELFAAGDKLVRDAHLSDRVVYLGALPFQELLRHAAACDLGILLYPDDGIGNYYQSPGRLTEYLNCGLPIVTSHFPGLELLVLKHSLGVACDPTCPGAIAGAIQQLAAPTPEERQARRHRLKELAKTVLAFDAHAWQLEKILAAHEGPFDPSKPG